MSSEGHDSYDHANKMEAANGASAAQLERLKTAGGHVNDRTQPSLPVVHRSLSRPEGAVGIIWVYIGIIVRNDGALRAGKKLYIYLCGLCVARDKASQTRLLWDCYPLRLV
jgi:hypothetical protein